MNAQRSLMLKVHDIIERPELFNAIQVLLDPGKGSHIRRFLKDLDYRSVLDLGCGTGNWAWVGRDRYLGIDTSESFIAACRKKYGNDSSKEFVQTDATELKLSQSYDLAILISVLHHLSDTDACQLVAWVGRNARYFFVLDLYPIPWNPVSRWLYRMDRGKYVRDPHEQRSLIESQEAFSLVRAEHFWSLNGLYRHTLFLFESKFLSLGG